MDQNRTLPAWTDLLQLLLKYILGMSLHSRGGERRGFLFIYFIFLGLIGSALTWSTLPGGPYRTAGPTQRP